MRSIPFRLLGLILMSLLLTSCGGGGGSPANPIIFGQTLQVGGGGASIIDGADSVQLIVPPGTFSSASPVTLQTRQHQRSAGIHTGFSTGDHAVDITVTADDMVDGTVLQIELPLPGTYDSFYSMMLLTDDGGSFLPVPASYDSSRKILVGTLAKTSLKYFPTSRHRASGSNSVGVFVANATPHDELASGGFRIFQAQPGGPGTFRDAGIADSMAGKKIAVVVHGWSNNAADMIDLARFLNQESRYDEVWAFEYNYLAKIDSTGHVFAQMLSARMAGAVTVDLYAHSMGGLVCRWALEKEGLGSQVRRLVTLGTPHEGLPSLIAQIMGWHWLMGPGAADMAAGSPFLTSLNDAASTYKNSAKYFTLAGSNWAAYGWIGPISEVIYNPVFHTIEHDGLVQQDSACGIDVLGNKSDAWSENPAARSLVRLAHGQLNGEPNPPNFDDSCGGADGSQQCVMVRAVRPWLPPSVASGYVFDRSWGTSGTGPGQFLGPMGIAIDSGGDVYVTDSGNSRIEKFTAQGQFVTTWGGLGTGAGQFDNLRNVAVDSSGIYVTDWNNGRVQKFTSSGTFIFSWPFPSFAPLNIGPEAIAADGNGHVYVTDGNSQVWEFTSDGIFITAWGSSGVGDGQFNYPKGIAVDPQGAVFVTDMLNNRVQKFTPDGQFITKWGSLGQGNGQMNQPFSLALGSDGNVFVAEYQGYRIQEFSAIGDFLNIWGQFGAAAGQFNAPTGVAVDKDGNVYVVDQGNNRIQRFRPQYG